MARTYAGNTKVDPAGELPGGKKFDGIVDFKKVMVERREQFMTPLTSKVLAYATGQRTTAADRPEIKRLLAQLHQRGDRMRDLVETVAMSQAFLSK